MLREIQVNARINTVKIILVANEGVEELKHNQLKTNIKHKNKQSKTRVV